jgi:hypothetical protein
VHTLRFLGNASFNIQAALFYSHQLRNGFSKPGSPQARRGTEVNIEDLVKPRSRAFEE